MTEPFRVGITKADVAIKDILINGYTKLNQVFFPDEIEKALEFVKYYYMFSKVSDEVPYLNQGQRDVYNLVNKDFFFIDMLTMSDEIERILIHFLNDKYYKAIPQDQPNYILRHSGARSSVSALPLHIDSFIPSEGPYVQAMQVAIFLEDSTIESGCTMVIPGSHLSGKYASQEDLPAAVPIECKAGDVLIWDARIHHCTSENKSNKTRWAIVNTFTRWYIKQFFDTTNNLPKEFYNSLTDKQKTLLGFHSIPFLNETFGIDMKRGYY